MISFPLIDEGLVFNFVLQESNVVILEGLSKCLGEERKKMKMKRKVG